MCYETLSSHTFTNVLFVRKVLTLPTFSVTFAHNSTFSTSTLRKTGKGNVIIVFVAVFVHTMTAYGKVKVQLHRFLTSTPYRGERLVSHPGFFNIKY